MITTEYQYFPVRCCCEPVKLLGFLSLPKVDGFDRTITDCNSQTHKIEIKMMCNYTSSLSGKPLVCFESAIYSEDRGIEFWRTIPGFIEAGAVS